MKQGSWVGSEIHRIRVNEIDQSRTASLPALVNLMQEVAWNNSTNLKYSVYDLMDHGVTWVVYRMQINVRRYPNQQEPVTVQSWPSGMDRLYTYRDYKILCADQKEIVRATSAWLVMDISKRELVSIPDFIRNGLDFSNSNERLELDKTKLNPVKSASGKFKTEVRAFNMDVNGHVYNTFYFQWILESMVNLKTPHKVESIDIQFKGESRSGDVLEVLSEEVAPGEFIHQVINMKTENELVRAKTKWSNKLTK